jgi:hypothetical protein
MALDDDSGTTFFWAKKEVQNHGKLGTSLAKIMRFGGDFQDFTSKNCDVWL